MTRTKIILAAVVLVLIGGTGALLARLQAHRQLGRPGLKMIAQNVYDEDGEVVNTNTVALPVSVPGYSSTSAPITKVEIGWLPKDTTFARRIYRADDNFGIMMSVVLMGTDRGSIHKPQICLVGQGWQIERSEVEAVPIPRPHPYDLPVMKITASKVMKLPDGRKVQLHALYVYWFVADGALTARHGERMWWMAKELLRTGTLQRWAYVSCLVHFLPGQEKQTFERLKRFLADAVPQFQLATGPPRHVLARRP